LRIPKPTGQRLQIQPALLMEQRSHLAERKP
jgi:hypothetical protein